MAFVGEGFVGERDGFFAVFVKAFDSFADFSAALVGEVNFFVVDEGFGTFLEDF